jgi:protein ImuB
VPTNDRAIWLKLLHHELEMHPPQAGILAVALTAEPGSTSKVQLGLFSPQLPEPSRLDVTLAHISKIVGEKNVGSAVLLDTHRRENFRIQRFTVSNSESRSLPRVEACTAMRELRPPEAAKVKLSSGIPQTLFFQQKRHDVEMAYGPWRASGYWWNTDLWGTEEWDLITRNVDDSLLCCCVVRDLMRNEWKIVGIYD